MHLNRFLTALSTLTLLLLPLTSAATLHKRKLRSRQLPDPATNVTTIQSPNGITIRYKEPGLSGVCETTPGVNSYSGYVDLAPDVHVFFYFFEARKDPASAPITAWLNGGPGSDSMIGLFQELGPCNVSFGPDYHTEVNPYSWSEVSNMIFISQPIGVGFSYGNEAPGSLTSYTGVFQNASVAPADGRYAVINATRYDTSALAAVAVWEVLQGFYSLLPQLDPGLGAGTTPKQFNLWTESYGGHYGPIFFDYFESQNAQIANGSRTGTALNFNTLGIGNGIMDELIQAPYYPEFAVNNTYGIKAINDTVYSYAVFAYYMVNGCRDRILACRTAGTEGLAAQAICDEAGNMCRDNVEALYYNYGGRGVYDIRHPYRDPTPPDNLIKFLNRPGTQQALGVDLNYTSYSNNDVYFAFQARGEYVYGTFLRALGRVLDSGVRVVLYYGDADYICNWFGGEAVSLQVEFSHATDFRAAGYVPFTVGGREYGEVREAGNFSFVRIYEAGHEVPFYQPEASLELFRRAIMGQRMVDGVGMVGPGLATNGTANATHTEAFVPLPTTPVPITQTTFMEVSGTSGPDPTGTFAPTTFDPATVTAATSSRL